MSQRGYRSENSVQGILTRMKGTLETAIKRVEEMIVDENDPMDGGKEQFDDNMHRFYENLEHLDDLLYHIQGSMQRIQTSITCL